MQHMDQNQINKLIHTYDSVESSLTFSSLLLDPYFHSTTATIEKAIHICLEECNGTNKVTKTYIKKVFDWISSNGFARLEDPAEDVMASKVWFDGDEYKVLLGIWEGCIHQTQLFIDVLESMPRRGVYLELFKVVKSVLVASDTVLENFDVPINTVGNEYPLTQVRSNSIEKFCDISQKLDVTMVHKQQGLPVLPKNKFIGLSNAALGKSELEAAPFIEANGKCYLALPTAITVCIRRLIYSFCKENQQLDTLTKNLAVALSERLRKLDIFGEFRNVPVRFSKRQNLDNWLTSSFSLEFDEGHYYQFIFFMDSLVDFDKDWFHGFLSPDDKLAEFIQFEIDGFKRHVTDNGRDIKICTIVVPCGFGRGLSIELSYRQKRDFIEIIGADDLFTLSLDKDCNPQRIWRLIEAQYLAENHDAHIYNINGFLNLYGYIKQNDFNLFNHSGFTNLTSEKTILAVGTNFQKDIRQKVLQNNDYKFVLYPDKGNILVRKGFQNSLFEQNDTEYVYCPVNLDKNLLQAVYHYDSITIWVEMPLARGVGVSVLVQIYKAYINWLPKIVEQVRLIDGFINNIKLIRLEVELPASNSRELSPLVKDEVVLDACSYCYDDGILECYFDINLFHGFSLPSNISEQALLRPVVVKFCNDSISHVNLVMGQVFSSPYARHFHVFECSTYSERVVESLESEDPITLDIASDMNHKFGLGWINGVQPEFNVISGKTECTAFLAKVVSKVWGCVQDKLKTLNKALLITALLENIELCQLHKTRWNKSFKANQYLQKDHGDLYKVATREVSMFTSAALASRLIIEMAICESLNDGGKAPSKMDIQELQSRVLSIHLLGGVSDAINYDAINPTLSLSQFGEILYESDFGSLIVNKYQEGLYKERMDSSANNYEAEFTRDRKDVSEQDVEDAFSLEFWGAWREEFGFTPNEAIDFINAVQDVGYTKEQLVFTVNRQELTSIGQGLNEEILNKIIDAFTLVSREHWTSIPRPYKSSDWQPWRFKRRYSLAYKPLIFISETDAFIISPEHMKRAFFHLLRHAHDATIDESHFHSKKMISWNGSKKAITGLEFNTLVANSFNEQYWQTEEEVKLTKILNKKLKDFGDVDVLAWHKSKNVVLAIECKNLEIALNQSEIARQIYEFKGNINQKGKSDRLHKHILRVDELKKDMLGLSKYVNKSDTDLKVIGMVVFSSLVPMHFVNDRASDIIFTDIYKLEDSLLSLNLS
ncbi:hypothetical protein ACFFK7_00770 [Pseudoalteromonas xiamenensis]|uniref:hypothetical protein n=1 Tax=Pseudoalteromonas xiamenensis TaxID=882626 RepID=UPI0035E59EBA